MPELFISYSRRDVDFTRKLVAGLKRDSADVWVDWEDIPPTSDWETEVRKGIDNANNVIFVLSPDWAASGECAKELAHAVKRNKRMFPIVCRDVDAKTIAPELAKLNWIFFRETNDFEAAIRTLNDSMATDLDWVGRHTRVLTRALEWDGQKRNLSFLLRGTELQDAEQWLNESGGTKQPDQLQIQYIHASRANAIQVQRRILIGVASGLVVSVVLAIVAAFQWQQANVKRAEAVSAQATAVSAEATAVAERDRATAAEADARRQAQIAFARELAAAALGNLSIDPERSVLLALQSAEATSPTLPDSLDALHWSLALSREQLQVLHPNVQSVALSPDGRLLATGSADNSATVCDVATKNDLYTFYATAGINDIAFNPDGSQLVTANEDGNAQIWDAATGGELLTLPAGTNYLNAAAFSPDGARVATVGYDGILIVFDAATGKELLSITAGANDDVADLAFSPDGRRIATASYSSGASVWDADSGAQLLTLSAEQVTNFTSIAFSPDGKQLLTSDQDSLARVWDAETGIERVTLYGHTDYVNDAVFSADGLLIATASNDGTAKLWDAATGRELFTLTGHAAGVVKVAFSSDGARLATASRDGTAKVWYASSDGLGELGVWRDTAIVPSVAFSPDGSRLAESTSDGMVTLRDSATGQVLWTEPGHTTWVNVLAFSADGLRLLTSSVDGIAKVWETATGRTVLTLVGQADQGNGAAFSPDGRRIVTSGENRTAKVWDAATGEELFTLTADLHYGRIMSAAFSADGTRLATAYSAENVIVIWDAASGQPGIILSGLTDTITKIAFGPKSGNLAAASWDRTVKVWDTASGNVLITLRGHKGVIYDVVYSADETLIATASSDGTAKVWDATSGQLLFTLPGSISGVFGVAFSPDGKVLATGDEDGTVRFYALKAEDLIAVARTRVTRPLTPLECKTYLHVDQCPAP